jgi:hypothetical protein
LSLRHPEGLAGKPGFYMIAPRNQSEVIELIMKKLRLKDSVYS